MNTKEIKTVAKAMLEKKAQKVVSLDLRPLGTAITDFFVICNADSTTAVSAIADNIIKQVKENCGRKPLRTQGLENNFWIILDYGDFVAHIFLTEYREFYKIEELWSDVPVENYED